LEPELGKLMVKKGKQLQLRFLFTKSYMCDLWVPVSTDI
jgi:hypothetical protein